MTVLAPDWAGRAIASAPFYAASREARRVCAGRARPLQGKRGLGPARALLTEDGGKSRRAYRESERGEVPRTVRACLAAPEARWAGGFGRTLCLRHAGRAAADAEGAARPGRRPGAASLHRGRDPPPVPARSG